MYPLNFFTLGLIGGLLAAALPSPVEFGGGALLAAVLLGISLALRRVFQKPESKKAAASFLLAAAGAPTCSWPLPPLAGRNGSGGHLGRGAWRGRPDRALRGREELAGRFPQPLGAVLFSV